METSQKWTSDIVWPHDWTDGLGLTKLVGDNRSSLYMNIGGRAVCGKDLKIRISSNTASDKILFPLCWTIHPIK